MITYVSEEDVKSSLNMKECIEELRKAFISYGKSNSDAHPRDRIIVDKNKPETLDEKIIEFICEHNTELESLFE